MGNMLSMLSTTTQTQEKSYDQVTDDRTIQVIRFIADNLVLGIELHNGHFHFQDFEIDDNSNMYCLYNGHRRSINSVIRKEKKLDYSVRPLNHIYVYGLTNGPKKLKNFLGAGWNFEFS